MKVLLGKEALFLRSQYISSFINCDCSYYRKHIAIRHNYVDGECYDGYLWNCFKKPVVITEDSAYMIIQRSKTQIYALLDIHSSQQILIPDYWKYPKEAVLSLSAPEFFTQLNTFPEDIYVFDSSFLWSVALTHEEITDGTRYCLVNGVFGTPFNGICAGV